MKLGVAFRPGVEIPCAVPWRPGPSVGGDQARLVRCPRCGIWLEPYGGGRLGCPSNSNPLKRDRCGVVC